MSTYVACPLATYGGSISPCIDLVVLLAEIWGGGSPSPLLSRSLTVMVSSLSSFMKHKVVVEGCLLWCILALVYLRHIQWCHAFQGASTCRCRFIHWYFLEGLACETSGLWSIVWAFPLSIMDMTLSNVTTKRKLNKITNHKQDAAGWEHNSTIELVELPCIGTVLFYQNLQFSEWKVKSAVE